MELPKVEAPAKFGPLVMDREVRGSRTLLLAPSEPLQGFRVESGKLNAVVDVTLNMYDYQDHYRSKFFSNSTTLYFLHLHTHTHPDVCLCNAY
jgi:hypothetical protein